MEKPNHILYAASLTGDGSGSPLSAGDIAAQLEHNDLAWLHMDARHPAAKNWLENNLTYLDPLAIDALLAGETRPRILELGKGALLILRGVNLNENADPGDMISIRLWIDEHRIISLERRPLKAVRDIQERLANGNGPKNPGDFICLLCARLFERMEPVLGDLDEKLDDIEEQVIEHPDASERPAITAIRKQAILLRRYIAPQRDVITHLRASDLSWLETAHKRNLQESLDTVTRYVEDLDAVRERAQIVKDELSSTLSDQMNKNLYMLSVVAAIFLPLGFLTGLLGINVGGIPGADFNGAFMVFCGFLIIIVALQLAVFKKLKWL